jgi:outer membrane protein assembly factor BamB
VQFEEKLLEHKTVEHQAMKPKGKSVLDGNVTASQGMELAQEMMNDSRRAMTGGVDVEDVSRYQVTLHRLFADKVPDWTGEVTGPPRFYALKTIDLVVAGQSVIALDHNNKKLWEGKVSYPISALSDHAPFLETRDAVYVADPGVLTCFDLATGTARWRLNSVGISALHTDPSGKVYVNTTTAGPDKIKYSQEVNIHERLHPVIMKVDPASGKVLWQIESFGDTCMMSGKFLYSTWVTATQSALKLEEGPDTHFNLYLLKPGSGGVIWNFHVDNQHVMQTEVQQNWILLRFADNLYVLKFFSL